MDIKKLYEGLKTEVTYDKSLEYWENPPDLIYCFKGIVSSKAKIEKDIKEYKCNVDEKGYIDACKNG